MTNETDCELCSDSGGDLLWQDALCRVVRVTDASAAAFPGFCRVIVNRHVREMSELDRPAAHRVMEVVFATERAIRQTARPDKINLASLGNVVPHLHWHVIPRWQDDSHFPAPIWAQARRGCPVRPLPSGADLLRALNAELSTMTERHEL